MQTNTTYFVTGMTCDHCVAAVTEELQGIEGVRDVEIDLVNGGDSRVVVTSDHPLPAEMVSAAVHEAGYALGDDPR